MRNKSIWLILLVAVVSLCCTHCKKVNDTETLPASSLQAIGRVMMSDRNHLELISSASHIGIRFSGSQCEVYAYINGNGHNYLQYEVDGKYQKRVKISGSELSAIVISGEGNGTHTAWIYKATEATTGPIFIEKVTGDDIAPIQKPSTALIEFIGNSITCGAASDHSEVACGTGVYHDQHNAYMAYGPRVARDLQVSFILSSVSGIGIYRNWNSDGPTMRQVYEKADFNFESNRLWEFSTYKPDIISIALGTNDLSNGDGIRARLPFDSLTFINNYVSFVSLIKSKYRGTPIVLLGSPMMNGPRRVTLQNCLTQVKESINSKYPSEKPIEVFFFKPMQARGCTGHPSVEDHAIIAEELKPFLRSMLPSMKAPDSR